MSDSTFLRWYDPDQVQGSEDYSPHLSQYTAPLVGYYSITL